MARLAQIDPAAATGRAAELLAAVKQAMGAVPNLTRVMAGNPAVLDGYLSLSGALAKGGFSAREREAVALSTAGANGCDYCASAHSFISGNLKVDGAEIAAQLHGRAADPRAAAILALSRRILETRGRVAEADLAAARAAGLSEADILETLGQTVLNIFTNYLNNLADTDIDFPVRKAA